MLIIENFVSRYENFYSWDSTRTRDLNTCNAEKTTLAVAAIANVPGIRHITQVSACRHALDAVSLLAMGETWMPHAGGGNNLLQGQTGGRCGRRCQGTPINHQ